MKVLRVNTINSDGSSAEDRPILFHPLDPETGKPYYEDDGTTVAVEVMLRPITEARHQRFLIERTEKLVRAGGAMEERTNFEDVRNDCVCYAITGWKGFVGADNKPLPCVDEAKKALDYEFKNEIVTRARRVQPVVVTAASFREPPNVSGVVGRLRQDDDVLPARQA